MPICLAAFPKRRAPHIGNNAAVVVSECRMKSQAKMVVIGGGVVGCSVHPGVGTAGFEQNFIVTSGGAEFLTRTPMLFW
jgi:hypothetical protein